MTSGGLLDALQLVGVALGLIGQVLISQKKRSAFVIWGISNIAIFALNVIAGLYLMAGLFAVYFGFCVYSFIKWRTSDKTVQS